MTQQRSDYMTGYDNGWRDALADQKSRPVNMVIYCPRCNTQHIDAPDGEWKNPPHKSHLCSNCKLIWRPADVFTNGVEDIKTHGKDDTSIEWRRQ